MNKMYRIIPAVVAAVAGCVAVDEEIRTEHAGIIPAESVLEDAVEPLPQPEHVGDWTAEELAVRAGRRSQSMQEGALSALIARIKADEDTAWRDPEFRYTGSWSDGDSSDYSRTIGNRSSDNGPKSTSGSGHKFSARVYIPNPFVNRYLSRKGDAEVRRCEAKAESDAFAVYSEVKLLCNEERRLRREMELLANRTKALSKAHDIALSETTNHVARSPYDLIRAESQLRRHQARVAETEFKHRQVRSSIATLADVPADGLVIAESSSALPSDDLLVEDRLVELAFARRPDLALAVAEYDRAVATAGAARAANIPWFRFVEAGYRFQDSDDSSSSYRDDGVKHSWSSDSDHDFNVEVAITVPLFTWCGGSVRATNRLRDLADARVRSLRDSIRREIADALAHYRFAASAVSDDADKFVAEMEKRIDGDTEGSVETADSCKARAELADYSIFANDAVALRDEALVNLETVIGGPVR